MNYHEISELIDRNERGVWASYQRAKKKLPSEFEIGKDETNVPVSIFKHSSLSILECLISYLKDVKKLKHAKIAKMLNKSPTNVWTIHNRSKIKNK